MTTRRSLKRQAMPKPSLKTRRKRLKQVRKLNLRRISKKRRLTKRSQRTLRSRKRKSPQSKSHKTKRPQSNTKAPQKETQEKKEDKQPVLENPVKSQPKDGPNEQKTIADAKQPNLKGSLEKEEASQRISEIVYLTIESQIRYQCAQTLGNSQSTTGNIPRNQEFAKTNKLRRTPGIQSSQ
ncbi:Hypothetical_protein [Hexamita inflata]|uniref:Hypothetical_protein n=1 Tax=Hexamita inflata TaxID=28002 RepID=A0AA86U471_9EUKA|nr:Hypothetical protein HINF_LOCUS27704 [Hexamita inflata]